jgi:protein MpaA
LAPATASATTIPVDTSVDALIPPAGGCSLRGAVQAANANLPVGGCPAGEAGEDVVLLDAAVAASYPLQIPNEPLAMPVGEDANVRGDLDVLMGGPAGGPVVIRGIGPARPAIDAGRLDRAIDVRGDAAFQLDGIRVTGGASNGVGDLDGGAGVRWLGPSAGDLTVTDSALDDNIAGSGSAILAETTGEHLIAGSTLSGNLAGGVGTVLSWGNLTVSESSILGNGGGAISTQSPASLLRIEASTIAGNSIGADSLPATVYAEGDMTVERSTVSQNTAGFVGGLWSEGALVVRFSTITENGAPDAGDNMAGGIDAASPSSVMVEGTIVAGNRVALNISDCNAPATEGAAPNLEGGATCGFAGPSLAGVDPDLAPLSNNGGPTATLGLYAESPALDAAGTCGPASDQRGEPRPAGAACDIGAFEGSVDRPTPTPLSPPVLGQTARRCPNGARADGTCKPKQRKCKRVRRGAKRRCVKKNKGRATRAGALSAAGGRTVIGRSVRGRPIVATRFGDAEGARVGLVVATVHGDERAGLSVARELRRFAPKLADTQLWLIRSINPDGLRSGARRNARGVDLNRNFPHRWRGGVPRSSGYYPGPRASSEPETRAAMRFIEQIQPDVSVWYHQPWGAVLACRGRPAAAARYSKLSGLGTSCRGRGLRGTAIGWQNSVIPGSSAFVVEFPAGAISQQTARRHARAAAIIARDG